MRKKLLALLLAAALALSLLAGCGGGKNQSLAQIILNLLDNQYTNVTVEIDPDLEAALRKAVSQAETEEEIRAALEEILGPGINFRLLGDGQKGDTAWNLILYPGNDPDAAGRSAFAEWNKVFAFLPKDGQYGTKIAMIETENGYAFLVQATVDRAGSRDNDDDEPDEPEKPKEPYEVTMDKTGIVTDITVGTSEGLSQILSGNATGGSEEENNALTQAYTNGFEDVIIKLEPNTTYTVSQQFACNDSIFKGTLQGADKKSTTITLTGSCNGLFQQIDSKGTVKDITFDVQTEIKNTYSDPGYVCAGAVAGQNNGTITSCDVKLNNSIIEAGGYNNDRAGGIVGQNDGKITGCTVTGGTIQVECGLAFAGGIVGHNDISGEITDCTVTGAIIKADGDSGGAVAGGLVGRNNGGEITGRCEVKGTRVTAQTNDMGANAGGLVGDNSGTVTAGTYTGSGTITATATDASGTACAGGLVGYNITAADKVTAQNTGTPSISAQVGSEEPVRPVQNQETGGTGIVPGLDTNKAYAGTRIGFQYTDE